MKPKWQCGARKIWEELVATLQKAREASARVPARTDHLFSGISLMDFSALDSIRNDKPSLAGTEQVLLVHGPGTHC